MEFEPANSQRVFPRETDFIDLQAMVQAQSAYYLNLARLHKLQNVSQVVNFEQIHRRAKILTLYTYIDKKDVELHCENGFSCFPKGKYAVFTQIPISEYSLECKVALYEPFTTDDQKLCEIPPPGGFDCYCLVSSAFVSLENGALILNENALKEHQIEYYVWSRNSIVPTRFLELCALKQTASSQLCDVCKQCFEQKIDEAAYFGDETLRDSYVPEACNAAVVYCEEDSAYLCSVCDRQIHKAPIEKEHKRNPIPEFEAAICQEHGEVYQFYDYESARCFCKLCVRNSTATEISEELIQPTPDPLPYFQNIQVLQESAEKLQQLTATTEESLTKNFKTNLRYLQKYSQFGIEQLLAQMIELARMHAQYETFASAVHNRSIPLDKRLMAQHALGEIVRENQQEYQVIDEVLSNFLERQAAIFENAIELMNFHIEVTNNEIKEIAEKQNDVRILGLLSKPEFEKEFSIADIMPGGDLQSTQPLNGGLFLNTQEIEHTTGLETNTSDDTSIALVRLQEAEFDNPELTHNQELYKTIGNMQSACIPVKPKSRRRHRDGNDEMQTDRKAFEVERERLRKEQMPKTETERLDRMLDEARLDYEATAHQKIATFHPDDDLFGTLTINQTMKLENTSKGENPLNYISFEPIDHSERIQTEKIFAYNDKSYSLAVPELSYDEKLTQLAKMYKIKLGGEDATTEETTGWITKNQVFEQIHVVPFTMAGDEHQRFSLLLFVSHFLRLTHGFRRLRFELPTVQRCSCIKEFFSVAENKSALLLINAIDETCAVFIPKVTRISEMQKYAFVVFLTSSSYEIGETVRIGARALEVGDVLLSEDFANAVIRGVQRKVFDIEINIYG